MHSITRLGGMKGGTNEYSSLKNYHSDVIILSLYFNASKFNGYLSVYFNVNKPTMDDDGKMSN